MKYLVYAEIQCRRCQLQAIILLKKTWITFTAKLEEIWRVDFQVHEFQEAYLAHLHLCSNKPPSSSYCTHTHRLHINISGILCVLSSRATALISTADSLLRSLNKNPQNNLIKDDWQALNLGNNQVALQSQTGSYENEPPWLNQNVSRSTLCSKCCRQTDNPPAMPCKRYRTLNRKTEYKRGISSISDIINQ